MHSRQVMMKDLKGNVKRQKSNNKRQRKDQDQDHKRMIGTKGTSTIITRTRLKIKTRNIKDQNSRKKEKSLDYNNSFLGEYKCSSLALDREERRDEKEEIGSIETRSNNAGKPKVGTVLSEKFEGWFEQDTNEEGGEDKEDEEGDGEV
ncbi:hypothetical protein Tco_0713570 [Tanacetum coccineum]